jgi:hypothetical protein
MNLKRTFKVAALKIKKHSPEILMGVGVVSLVGAVGTAIWKTATCDKILDEHEEKMAEAERHVKEQHKKIKEEGADIKDGKIIYTDEDAANDIKLLQTKQWMKTVRKFAWHYAPTIALTALSATSFLGAFCIVKGRYTAVAGALAATTSAFDAYRKRVVEDQGEEKDLYYRYGVKKESVSVKGEDGKTKKKDILTADEEVKGDGIITFVFDDRSREYYKDMSTNIISLNGIRATMDIDLQTEGFLTARDILKRLDVWDYVSKEDRRKSLRYGYYDDGKTHVDFDLYSIENKDKIMHPESCGGDFLILELRGLKPLDLLID